MEDQKSDEVLMSICAAAQGCFEIDLETGGPHENCVYSELIQSGYTSDSLTGADEKDTHSINFPTAWSLRTQIAPMGQLSIKCIPNV